MTEKKSLLNISIGLISRIMVLIITIISKSYLVRSLGPSVNGIFSLFTDIVGFLSIANLGLSTAIIYSMYRPIVEGDIDQVSALYHKFKKSYRIIFSIILIVGLGIIPFISILAKDYPQNININLSYVVFLLSVILNYLYAHKTSLIIAYKDNYVTTLIHSSSMIIQGVLQIIVLLLTKSFFLFLFVGLFTNLIEFVFIEYIFRKKYKKNINSHKTLDIEIQEELTKNIKSVFITRVGDKLISSLDSIIISYFFGLVILGRYSNYVTIISSMIAILQMFFSEITSIIGHSFVSEDSESFFKKFKTIYYFNFILSITFFLGYYSVINNVIGILFGNSEIIKDKNVIRVITLSFFLFFMNRTVNLFKTSSGLFYEDRFRPIVEGVVNIILSILLVQKYNINGVLIATIITRLLISYTYEPFILFKYRLNKNLKKFYIINYLTVVIIFVSMILFDKFLYFDSDSHIKGLIINGLLSIAFTLIVVIISFINKDARNTIKEITSKQKVT